MSRKPKRKSQAISKIVEEIKTDGVSTCFEYFGKLNDVNAKCALCGKEEWQHNI